MLNLALNLCRRLGLLTGASAASTAILLEDDSSILLLEDDTSALLLE